MNKNKKIISASLALALGVSLIIPNAKANEEKSVEKALKEPVKTSEKVKTEEKSAVENEKITINKAPVNEGETGADKEETGADKEETGADKEEKGTDKEETGTDKEETGTDKEETGTDKEETGADKEEKGTDKEETGADKEETGTDKKETEAGKEEKPDDKKENPETDEEKPKDEKKVKPKEFKMSEVYKNKDSFEVIKTWIMYSIRETLGFELTPENEKNLKAELDRVGKAKNLEELMEATKRDKAFLAKVYLFAKDKITFDELYSDLVKIIDDMANQKPQNPSQKNPNRKNKKTGTTNTANTANTGNKVNNAGENVQTGVGSLSAILGLLGASSLGLFKSKRK